MIHRFRGLVRAARSLPWHRWLLGLAAVWACASLALAVVVHVYGGIDHARPADVLVVLGGGVNRNDTPTTAERARTNRAADLWQQGLAPVIICTGGRPSFATISEAETCRDILVNRRGIPASAVVLEDRSRSTQENALYTAEIMRAHDWRTAVIVSDAYHLLRSQWIFSNVGIVSYTSPVLNESYLGIWQYINTGREVVAFQWLALIRALHLPFTYVPLI